MPAPSQLSIATSVVNRLVKEEASYHKELAYQRASIKKLEEGGGDENAEYLLRQEKKGVEETQAIFPQLNQRLQDALKTLQDQLDRDSQSPPEEVTKAKEAIAAGQKTLQA